MSGPKLPLYWIIAPYFIKQVLARTDSRSSSPRLQCSGLGVCGLSRLDGIISIGHIYFHGSLIVRLSKHGNTFKIAMKSGKWDARANKMPIFYGQPRDERLAGWQV